MRRISFLIVFMTLMISATIAQGDQKARAVVDALSSKMKTYKGLSANFKLTTRNSSSQILNSSIGKILVKDNRYYIKQGANEIFSDGIKIWNYNGNNEVTVTNVADDPQGISPQALLTGFNNKDYTATLISSSATTNQVQLIPIDKRKNFKKATLFVDKVKSIITKANIVDKGNNTIEFSLTNVNTNATLSDSVFLFDKGKYKKNIEVIE